MTRSSEGGFSLTEVLLVLLIVTAMAVTALPGTTTAFRRYHFASATRGIAAQVRSARLRAVTTNTTMRVRFNCPVPGQLRVVELVGTPAIDDAGDRCSATIYPYPDRDDTVAPNLDGPVMVLQGGIRLDQNTPDIDISPNGRITAQTGGLPLTIVVTDTHETRSITISVAGRVRSS